MHRVFGTLLRFSVMTTALTVCVIARAAEPHAGQSTQRWPQFRGHHSDGIAVSAHPDTWSETESVDWKIDVPGEGWSCPVIWDDMLFLTSAVPVTDQGKQNSAPEDYRGGGGNRRDDLTQIVYQWQVMCLDANSGELRWQRTAKEAKPSAGRHSSNTYATETPITDGKFVYAYFGMNGLYCFDIDGNPVWQRELGSFPMRAGWGTSSSPVLSDGKLFVQVDNEEDSFLVAIDAKTGEDIWRVGRDERSQYSSPIIWKNSLRDELIIGGMFYRSYDPATGKLLWKLDMEKGRSSATPLAVGDVLYVGTEFRNRGGADDGGGFLYAIKPGGSGNLTTTVEPSSESFIRWKLERSGIQMASPVHCNGKLYLLERRSGVIHCVDAETGTSLYRSRIPGARAFWSSPWTNGKEIFCVDTSGTTCVLDSGDRLQLLRQNKINEQTWSTPAIANGAVYFRTASKLYRIAGTETKSDE